MTISGEVAPRKAKRSKNYLQLLALAHDQLVAELGDKYSTAALLRVAQLLVEVSDAYYVPREAAPPRIYPNYFTLETAEMIEHSPWMIFCKETACHDVDLDGAELAAIAAREKSFLR